MQMRPSLSGLEVRRPQSCALLSYNVAAVTLDRCRPLLDGDAQSTYPGADVDRFRRKVRSYRTIK